MTGALLLAICVAIFVVLPTLCGVASWWSCRLEHRQHRRNMDDREAAVTVRERQVEARAFEIGRRAHDLRTMLNMRQIAIENDTTVLQILDWEPYVGNRQDLMNTLGESA